MKEPLGRIHPHGSGGKSVYQRAAQESNEVFDGFCGIIFGTLGILLLSVAAIGFLIALFSTPGAGEGFAGICALAAAGKALLD